MERQNFGGLRGLASAICHLLLLPPVPSQARVASLALRLQLCLCRTHRPRLRLTCSSPTTLAMPVDSASLEAKIRECWPDATHVVRLKQVGGQRDSRTDSPALFLVPSLHSKSSTSAVRIAAFGGRDGRDGRIDSLDLSQVAAAPFVPPSLQPTDPLADLLLTSLLPCADVPTSLPVLRSHHRLTILFGQDDP